jgi:hypothetical protein
VVGTPIKNRVLPYKKESEADTGKVTASSGTALAAAQQIEKANKQRAKDLKKSLSPEDYALSKLSEVEQKALVKRGVVSQKKLDGLKRYIEGKKEELGYEVPEGSELVKNIPKDLDKQYVNTLKKFEKIKPKDREKYLYEHPSAEFEFEKAKFEKDLKNGKVNRAEKVRKTGSLARLEAGKDTPKEVRDLYSLSKAAASKLVRTSKDGAKVAKDLLAYGDKLVKAGIEKKNKFRDKKGNEAFSDPTGSPSAKRGKGRRKTGATFGYGVLGLTEGLSTEKSLRALVKKAQL